MSNNIEYIFHQFYAPLCNYASIVIHDHVVAEDIVQTLFIQLYENDSLNKIDNMEAYLLRSVRFKCIDHLRQIKRSKTVDFNASHDELLDEPHEITEEEIEPLFHYYAAKLPPKTREVFLMSRVNKLTYKEIAAELNISSKTVENQMGSALKKLRKVVGKDHFCFLFL